VVETAWRTMADKTLSVCPVAVPIPVYPSPDFSGMSDLPIEWQALGATCWQREADPELPTDTLMPSYDLTVNKVGNGSGTVTGAGSYQAGAKVVLTATPDTNSVFTGWSPASCAAEFSMPASALDCMATFTIPITISNFSCIINGTGVGMAFSWSLSLNGTTVTGNSVTPGSSSVPAACKKVAKELAEDMTDAFNGNPEFFDDGACCIDIGNYTLAVTTTDGTWCPLDSIGKECKFKSNSFPNSRCFQRSEGSYGMTSIAMVCKTAVKRI